jgi:hypothetical protein
MNFNAVTVTMFGIGAILIYSAVKDTTPKEVITNAFASQSAKPAKSAGPSSNQNSANRSDRSNPGTPNNFEQPFATPSVYPSN